MGQGDPRGLHSCLVWLLVRILRPWASDPEDWIPPTHRHVQDDRQLPPPPGSLSNCCDNPAFSKVIESTGLLPPQCVVQASSRNGRLLNSHPGFGHTNLLSILSNLPWQRLGRTCCTNVASPAHWKLCTKQLRSNWYLLAPAPSHWVCSEEMALTSHRVAKKTQDPHQEGDAVLWHGVLHHTAGYCIRMTVSAWGPGPPWDAWPTGSHGAQCPLQASLPALNVVGLFLIPSPAVLRMEEDQSKSPLEDLSSRWFGDYQSALSCQLAPK